MKKSMMVCAMLIACMGGGMLAGCGGGNNDNDNDNNDSSFDLPDAPAGTIISGENQAIVAGDFQLKFVKNGDGYGISLVDSTAQEMFKNDTPAMLNVRGPATTLLGSFSESSYSASYSKIAEKDFGYLCSTTVSTKSGSKVFVEDAYYLTGGTLALSRRTEVKSAKKEDVGFQTVYSFLDPSGSKSYNDFEYFIPAIIYKDTNDMTGNAIGAGLNVDKMYVKETRTGLPLAMLRSKATKNSLAIAHLNPKISVNGELGGGYNGAVNNKLQYGSIGYTIKQGVSVDFCYPSAEGPITYDNGAGWSKIYHTFETGTVQEYGISIVPSKEETFADTLTATYQKAYMAEKPAVTDQIIIDDIYDYNIEIFNDNYKEFGSGAIKAAGVPWTILLATGEPEAYTFQMGFVGQQTSVAHHLLTAGYQNNDPQMIEKGKTIVNFWTSPSIMRDKVPVVWWDPSDNESAGASRGYPSFLRCFVDGMDGVLDSYRIAQANGEDMTVWKDAVLKVADFLVTNQNQDGSYYRAYETNGSVCTRTDDNRYQGTSKLNTPVAVRFLVRIYELTGEEKYKEAALKAIDFSYNNLYLNKEKFVGGTPDNPNTVDKEASIYGMYCFNAAYMLTNDAKYLKASEYAAACAMSWVYAYDFACPASSVNAAINPFSEEGRVIGFSLIATGHSAADNFSAYMYYEMFKLYIFTGNEFYLDAARLLQNNTKLSTDYNGKMGWKYRALGPEASNVCDFSYGTVGVWLPWSGNANIEPIANMRNTFGNGDIDALNMDLSALRAALNAYGAGGKLIEK